MEERSDTGLTDMQGNALLTGDVVKFRFTQFSGDPGEPDVGLLGTDEFIDMEAFGVAKWSPYSGVYIVHHGRTFRMNRRRWFEVMGPLSENAALIQLPAEPIEESRRTTYKVEAK